MACEAEVVNGARECVENSGGWGFPLGFPRAKDKDLTSPRNDAVFIVDYIDNNNNNKALKSAAAPVGFLSVAVAACRSCIANDWFILSTISRSEVGADGFVITCVGSASLLLQHLVTLHLKYRHNRMARASIVTAPADITIDTR